jgi:hypothetical protein
LASEIEPQSSPKKKVISPDQIRADLIAPFLKHHKKFLSVFGGYLKITLVQGKPLPFFKGGILTFKLFVGTKHKMFSKILS